MQVADDLAGSMHLDGGFGAHVAVHDPAANDDGGDVDFGVNLGALSNDERVVAPDLALEDAIDADTTLEVELAFEFRSAPEESGNLGGRELLIHAFLRRNPGSSRPAPAAAGDGKTICVIISCSCILAAVVGRRRFFAWLPCACVLVASVALAQPEMPSRVQPHRAEKGEGTNPLRGSTLLLDQSMTTQTAHLDSTPQQSYVPLYELWLSLRPRYHFDEHWSMRGRLDYTKELTNNQQTTYYREDVFGDIWTDLVYQTKLESLWPGTKADIGLRALWPTSKASQAAGTYVTAGARGGVQHTFPINGEDARYLDDFHVRLSFTYLHPFTTATTPTDYGSFAYTRQNVDEFSFVSDQIQGTTIVDHTFWAIVDTGLQITPKLSLTADLIFINQWHYPPSNASVGTALAPVDVPRSATDTQFTENTWFIANLDYSLVDEIDLGLGYYNLANAIAPDGQRRGVFGSDNIWWSPDARVFFDVTANLDALFDDASGHKYGSSQSLREPRRRHMAADLR